MKKEQSISTPSILGFQPFRFEVVNTPKGTLGHSHSIHVNVIEAQGSVSLLGTIFWMSYGLSVASNQPKWFKWSTQSKCNVVEYIEKDRTVFISQSDLRVLPDMCVLSSFAGSKPSHNHKSHKISFAYHPLKVPQVFCVFLWLGWALAAFYVSPQWPSSQLFVPVPPSHVTAEHFGLMSSAKLSRSSHLFFGVAFSKGKIGLKKNLRRCTRLGHFSFCPSLCFFQLGEFLGHSRQRLALVAGLKLPGDGEVEACRCQVLLLLFGRCLYGQLWSNWLSWTFQLTNVLALLMLFKWKSLY